MASRLSEGGVVSSPVVLITCAGDGREPIYSRKEEEMSSRARGSVSTERHATSTQTVASEIRIRAYEIYLERGEQPGRELDDWLQAELELAHGLLRGAQGV